MTGRVVVVPGFAVFSWALFFHTRCVHAVSTNSASRDHADPGELFDRGPFPFGRDPQPIAVRGGSSVPALHAGCMFYYSVRGRVLDLMDEVKKVLNASGRPPEPKGPEWKGYRPDPAIPAADPLKPPQPWARLRAVGPRSLLRSKAVEGERFLRSQIDIINHTASTVRMKPTDRAAVLR
jgi:hypothetical protein